MQDIKNTQLIEVLKEIFQLNQPDLDFGIYRIMNQKSAEISDFLENKLIPQVKAIIEEANLGDSATIAKELEEAITNLQKYKVDPDTNDEVIRLRHELAQTPSSDGLQKEIFSALTNFFQRYYDNGDFISKRRYRSEDTYAIPYSGEEVKLYWANHDQYYIKTSEYLKNYAFKIPLKDRKVRFELVEATTEKDNNKETNGKERRFKIASDKPLEVQGNELIIYFTYLPNETGEKQADLNDAAFEVIKNNLHKDWKGDILIKVPTEANKDRTLIEKHINDFTARNTFDYFIHKNLGEFLRRELDFYIKNEILFLEDIDLKSPKKYLAQLTKMNAIRKVADKVITFLEQLENFQKKLWLKKKFVVETNYCMTLDKIDKSFYAEIAENEAQWIAWENLFAISDINKDELSGAEIPRLEFMEHQPFLVLDTQYFSTDFKDRLLATFEDLEAETDGLLINSENFQALNLLQERYREEVKCVYIDPPYNAKSSEIIYKNTFKHSSWLSFIENRVSLGKKLLRQEDGINVIAIDENEQERLGFLLDEIFPHLDKTCVTVIHNPAGIQGHNFSYTHEFAYFNFPFGKNIIGKTERNGDVITHLRDWGPTSDRMLAKTCFYPIIIKDEKIIGVGEVCDVDFHPESLNVVQDDGSIYVYPMDDMGKERKWVFSKKSTEKNIKNLFVREKDGNYFIMRRKNLFQYRTVWNDKSFYANIYGSKLLNNIIPTSNFSFPKSIHLVKESVNASTQTENEITNITLDYFAGSGTTGHAVINLNREDEGNRKYILVEMGEYFNSVTKPRIEKVIYSANWKDGKPTDRKGSSHLFKYVRLESYEDTLNNLRLQRTENQDSLLALDDTLYEEYLLGYALDVESQGSLLSVDDFQNPFEYQLNITADNETSATKVDLVETFNYLIGLKVAQIKVESGFKTVSGTNKKGQSVLVIWRNQIENDDEKLSEFFQAKDWHKADNGFDVIYINGSNTVAMHKEAGATWRVLSIEEAFTRLMFEAKEV